MGAAGAQKRRRRHHGLRIPVSTLTDRHPGTSLPWPHELRRPTPSAPLARTVEAGKWDTLNLRVRLPGGKYDLNANGGMSTDAIGLGYDWANADYRTREGIFQDHLAYDQGLLWFLGHDRRVAASVRDAVSPIRPPP